MDNPDFFHLLFRLVGELHKQRLITAEEKSSIKGSTNYSHHRRSDYRKRGIDFIHTLKL